MDHAPVVVTLDVPMPTRNLKPAALRWSKDLIAIALQTGKGRPEFLADLENSLDARSHDFGTVAKDSDPSRHFHPVSYTHLRAHETSAHL
eukprot:4146330-Alexandrium_andersonii.AAC.1